MAIIDSVIQGQSAVFSVDLLNADGTAFITTTAPSFVVRDFNGNLVTQGVGSQDTNTPSRWTASITIPPNAPVTSDSTNRYTIQWSAFNATTKLSQISTSAFSVNGAVDFNVIELDRLALERTPLVDSLAITVGQTILQLRVTLRNEDGAVLYDSGTLIKTDIPTPILSQGYNVYTFNSKSAVATMTADGRGTPPVPSNQNTALGSPYAGVSFYPYPPPASQYQTDYLHQTQLAGFSPLCVQWDYVTQNGSENEFHFLYVVNTKIIILVHQLRKLIDKARSQNPNIVLQYTDVDLVEYLNQGMNIVNMLGVTMTQWTLVTAPSVVREGIIMLGAFVALSAQYLAEGESAFEMSGANVNLNIDRTPYIDATIGRMCQQFIDTHIPRAKKLWLRTTGGNGTGPGGALGVNYGPTLGRVWRGGRFEQYLRIVHGI